MEHDGKHPTAPDGREEGVGRLPVGQRAGLIKINGQMLPINSQILPPEPRQLLAEVVPPNRSKSWRKPASSTWRGHAGVGNFRCRPSASAAPTRR
jgi:hypothetical protein